MHRINAIWPALIKSSVNNKFIPKNSPICAFALLVSGNYYTFAHTILEYIENGTF